METLKERTEIFQQKMKKIIEKLETPLVDTALNEKIANNNTEIQKTVSAIKASCDIVGQQTANILQSCNIQIEECEKAELRQKALIERIKQFLEEGDLRRWIKIVGLSFGIGYTIYYVLRYRTIPLKVLLKVSQLFFQVQVLPLLIIKLYLLFQRQLIIILLLICHRYTLMVLS